MLFLVVISNLLKELSSLGEQTALNFKFFFQRTTSEDTAILHEINREQPGNGAIKIEIFVFVWRATKVLVMRYTATE